MKEDLDPLIKQLLALKVSYKEVTGDDFDPPKPEKKKGPATQESKREGPSKTELNKMAKKAAKVIKTSMLISKLQISSMVLISAGVPTRK